MTRIERHGRLVGEQDGRFRRERASQRHTRLLAAGQFVHRAQGQRFRRRCGKRTARPPAGRHRSAARMGRHADSGRAPRSVRPASANGTNAPAADRRDAARAVAAGSPQAAGLRAKCARAPAAGRRARASTWSCRRRSVRPVRTMSPPLSATCASSTIVRPPSVTPTHSASQHRRGHDGAPSSVRRSLKIIARKNGTPIRAVTTPIFSSMAEGTMRTATSARDQQSRAGQRRGQHHPRRIGTDGAAHEMRRDQTDKADRTRHRDRGPDAECDAGDHGQARAHQIDAERGGGVLAERQRAEGARIERKHDPARDQERRRDQQMIARAVLQRSKQPEHHFERDERIGREIEDERGRGAGETCERKAGQQHDRQAGAAAGNRHQPADRDQRAGNAGKAAPPARSPAQSRTR